MLITLQVMLFDTLSIKHFEVFNRRPRRPQHHQQPVHYNTSHNVIRHRLIR